MTQRTPRPPRVAAFVAVTGLLVGCAQVAPDDTSRPRTPHVTPSASPTPEREFTGVAKTGKKDVTLKVRNVPDQAGSTLEKIADGSSFRIECRVDGDFVEGITAKTAIWDRVTVKGKQGYVSAAYVEGGANKSIPLCTGAVPTVQATPKALPKSLPSAKEEKIVAIARSQVGIAEGKGNCNPYGSCEPWCGDFTTWVWQQAGIKIKRYPFTGDIYRWGVRNKKTHDGAKGAGPGDMVLYGTGPKTVETSVHVDIVVQALPDGYVVVGGNVDDRVTERKVPFTNIYAWVDA